MSNNDETNQQEAAKGVQQQKAGGIGKVLSFPISWFKSLIGKGTAGGVQKNGTGPESQTSGVSSETVVEEDRVVEDIKTFKSFVNRKLGIMKKKVEPTTTKVASKTSEKVKKTNFLSFTKMLVVIVILVLIPIVGLRLFGFVKDNGGNGKNGPAPSTPTPTPVSYQPYIPSIYATDLEVLRLEEDINVLSRELSTAVFRETRLDPPQLDFNINF